MGLGLIWATGVSSAPHLAANLLASYFLIWGLMALLSGARRLPITLRFSLTNLTVGFLLLGFEGLVFTGLIDCRILFATPLPVDRPWLHPGQQFDPELHYIHRPSQRLTGIAPKGNRPWPGVCRHPPGVSVRPPGWMSQGLRRTEEVLSAAYDLTRREGIDLVVAFLPEKFRVYKDVVDLPNDAGCLDWPIKQDLPQRLATMVARISPAIRYLDLTPVFVGHAQRGELLYLLDDSHWSADGHRVAAETLSHLLSTHVRDSMIK